MTRLDREKLWAATHMKRLHVPDQSMSASYAGGTAIESTARFMHMIWKTRHARMQARLTAQLWEGTKIRVERTIAENSSSHCTIEFSSTLEAAMWLRIMWRMGYEKGTA